MPSEFKREELYNLFWSEPMYILATNYSITGTGLAKASKKADIPTNERGYSNKLKVGKKILKPPLPLRGIGISYRVT